MWNLISHVEKDKKQMSFTSVWVRMRDEWGGEGHRTQNLLEGACFLFLLLHSMINTEGNNVRHAFKC